MPETDGMTQTAALAPGEHGITIDGIEVRYHVAARDPYASFIPVDPVLAGST